MRVETAISTRPSKSHLIESKRFRPRPIKSKSFITHQHLPILKNKANAEGNGMKKRRMMAEQATNQPRGVELFE